MDPSPPASKAAAPRTLREASRSCTTLPPTLLCDDFHLRLQVVGFSCGSCWGGHLPAIARSWSLPSAKPSPDRIRQQQARHGGGQDGATTLGQTRRSARRQCEQKLLRGHGCRLSCPRACLEQAFPDVNHVHQAAPDRSGARRSTGISRPPPCADLQATARVPRGVTPPRPKAPASRSSAAPADKPRAPELHRRCRTRARVATKIVSPFCSSRFRDKSPVRYMVARDFLFRCLAVALEHHVTLSSPVGLIPPAERQYVVRLELGVVERITPRAGDLAEHAKPAGCAPALH